MSIYNFADRHIGTRDNDIIDMLKTVGASSVQQLIQQTIPNSIYLPNKMNLPESLSQSRYIEQIKKIAQKNKNYRSYIGMGYFNTNTMRKPYISTSNYIKNMSKPNKV